VAQSLVQLAIIFAAPVMTPLMVQVETILRRLANAKAPMPNNPILGTLAGSRGRSSASRALERLASINRLRIERDVRHRRVVFPDGAMTGWGEARPGHRPYSTNAPGTIPRPPVRRPLSPALPPSVPPGPPIFVGPAMNCQWPQWGDGVRPTGLFCGLPSQEGRSWCVEHTYVVHGVPLGPKQHKYVKI
jgi:hypothetical protein